VPDVEVKNVTETGKTGRLAAIRYNAGADK
jgi:hypothetical protein